MKTSKITLNSLHLSDVYSLLLFVLYRVKDVPDYAVLSELCYLLDGSNITRLLTYFAGKTITFPKEEDLVILTETLLVYQYVSVEGNTLVQALERLNNVSSSQKEKIVDLYLKILPIMSEYNIDRGQIYDGR